MNNRLPDATREMLFGVSAETEWSMKNQFALDRSPRNIWIMGSDGEDRKKLTDGPHVDERPCISPDGEHVVFVSNRSGSMNLWAVSTDTGALELADPDELDMALREHFLRILQDISSGRGQGGGELNSPECGAATNWRAVISPWGWSRRRSVRA